MLLPVRGQVGTRTRLPRASPRSGDERAAARPQHARCDRGVRHGRHPQDESVDMTVRRTWAADRARTRPRGDRARRRHRDRPLSERPRGAGLPDPRRMLRLARDLPSRCGTYRRPCRRGSVRRRRDRARRRRGAGARGRARRGGDSRRPRGDPRGVQGPRASAARRAAEPARAVLQPEVGRRQGRALPPGRRGSPARHRADRAQAEGRTSSNWCAPR